MLCLPYAGFFLCLYCNVFHWNFIGIQTILVIATTKGPPNNDKCYGYSISFLKVAANSCFSRDTVAVLMAKCEMTEEEVVAAYSDFNENNPEGIITKAAFLDSMEVTNLHSAEIQLLQEKLIAESLFRVFDEDNSGALNFSEYLQVNTRLVQKSALACLKCTHSGNSNGWIGTFLLFGN